MSSTAVARRGQFSSGLVATSGGMAPVSTHPGLRGSQRASFQPASRERAPSGDARENKAFNTNETQTTSTGGVWPYSRGEAAPTGRRHLDPHHFTNLSDEAKRQEGRLGRAHIRAPHTSLSTGTFNRVPVANGQADTRRVRNRNLETSIQLAENRLRRIANGKDGAEVESAQQAAYQAAARKALEDHRGDPAIVQDEHSLAHRIASDAYAQEAARRLAATEDCQRRRYADRQEPGTAATAEGCAAGGGGGGGALGSPAPGLESSTPFALDTSRPRPDNNLSVTGGHGLRIAKDHNRDHFPITGPPPSAALGDAGRSSEGDRAAAEEARRRQNEKHYEHRGMKGDRPFDDAVVSGQRYPSPPPVGVSVGLYAKPRMVRPVPGQHRSSEDRDTIALKRARAQAPYNRHNMESSGSVERPECVVQRTEASQPQQLRQPPASLRERTEARWKREEAERESRRTGRARVAAHNQHTPLW